MFLASLRIYKANTWLLSFAIFYKSDFYTENYIMCNQCMVNENHQREEQFVKRAICNFLSFFLSRDELSECGLLIRAVR